MSREGVHIAVARRKKGFGYRNPPNPAKGWTSILIQPRPL